MGHVCRSEIDEKHSALVRLIDDSLQDLDRFIDEKLICELKDLHAQQKIAAGIFVVVFDARQHRFRPRPLDAAASQTVLDIVNA